ncbi:hypothetical protein [Sphingobium yanoikuyae]|uniref:hypothetical protein n=1 Tax=Sphingobium yanoikuyae TaxID=13690 RepID=UPI0031E0E0DE
MTWLPLTWEAVATFLTGIAAVLAALSVARRQERIVSRQIDLQNEQTKLQELSLRKDVFDKRFDVYVKLREHSAILIRAKHHSDVTFDDYCGFHEAAEKSILLFSRKLHLEIENFATLCEEFFRCLPDAVADSDFDDSYLSEVLERNELRRMEITRRRRSLTNMFVAEMALSNAEHNATDYYAEYQRGEEDADSLDEIGRVVMAKSLPRKSKS